MPRRAPRRTPPARSRPSASAARARGAALLLAALALAGCRSRVACWPRRPGRRPARAGAAGAGPACWSCWPGGVPTYVVPVAALTLPLGHVAAGPVDLVQLVTALRRRRGAGADRRPARLAAAAVAGGGARWACSSSSPCWPPAARATPTSPSASTSSCSCWCCWWWRCVTAVRTTRQPARVVGALLVAGAGVLGVGDAGVGSHRELLRRQRRHRSGGGRLRPAQRAGSLQRRAAGAGRRDRPERRFRAPARAARSSPLRSCWSPRSGSRCRAAPGSARLAGAAWRWRCWSRGPAARLLRIGAGLVVVVGPGPGGPRSRAAGPGPRVGWPRSARPTANPYDQRPLIWAEGLRLVAEAPLLGHGPGGYFLEAASDALRAGAVLEVEHAHHLLLNTAVEFGLVGLVALLALVAGLGAAAAAGPACRCACRAPRRRRRWLPGVLAAALVPVLAHGMLDYPLRNPSCSPPCGSCWPLLMAACAVVLRRHPTPGGRPMTSPAPGSVRAAPPRPAASARGEPRPACWVVPRPGCSTCCAPGRGPGAPRGVDARGRPAAGRARADGCPGDRAADRAPGPRPGPAQPRPGRAGCGAATPRWCWPTG